MNNDKIIKLLLSPNHADFLIALEFLKEKSIEDVASMLGDPLEADFQTEGLKTCHLDDIRREDREYKLSDNLYLLSANRWLDFHNKPIKNVQYIKL